MSEEIFSTQEWLRQELGFINDTMASTLNGRLKAELHSFDDRIQELILRFPLQGWQVNGLGTLHGGMLSTMMDLAMSMAVYCFSRQTIPPTISIAINYLRPVPMDEDCILIRARVTSIGKRNATAYCEAVIPGSGKVACTSIGTYATVNERN